MKAIVTVIGKDRVGIISQVSAMLAEENINVLDISQTVMREYFTMIMLVDASNIKSSFGDLAKRMADFGDESGLSIRIQREDIFNAMHRI